MHELAITEQIVRMVTKQAEEAGVQAVTQIRLVAPERWEYAAESIRLYFGMITEGTICEGALLEFERSPANEFYLDSIEVIT